jgi:hypothetical protein
VGITLEFLPAFNLSEKPAKERGLNLIHKP